MQSLPFRSCGWLLAASLLTISQRAPAQSVPAFMRIDGIQCESIDSRYRNWCEVLAFSFSGSAEPSIASGGGASARASLGDVAVVKPIDMGSPKIFETFAAMRHLRTIELSFVKTLRERDPGEYLKIELFECFITKVNYGFAQEGVSIWWTRIRMTYRPVRADGTLGPAIVTGWDRIANRPF